MRSYLVEIAETLSHLTHAEAEYLIPEAIDTIDQMASHEHTHSGWTEEDTLACIIGSAANKITYDGDSRQAILELQTFGKIINEMFTEKYKRETHSLVDDARRIRMGILGAHALRNSE